MDDVGSLDAAEGSAISGSSMVSGGEVQCHHQVKAALYTSWSRMNPGRRFLRCRSWKEVAVMLINQRDGLKEKLRLVEEMKDLAGEKVKLLEEKIVKLKKAKAKQQEENRYLRLEISRQKGREKIYVRILVFSWLIMLLLYWLLPRIMIRRLSM